MALKLFVNGWKIGQRLLVACILFVPIVGINETIEMFTLSGTFKHIILGESISLERIIRDSLILLFYIYLLCWTFLRKGIRPKREIDSPVIVTLFMATLISILSSVLYSIFVLDVPLMVIILSFKIFLYMPLFFGAFYLLKHYPPGLLAIRRSICFVLSFELLVGFTQIFYLPPYFGQSLLGSLPLGTFDHYTIYGAFLIVFVFGHLFVRNFQLPKILFAATVFMILASGSRTAVLVMILLVILWVHMNCLRRPESRGAMLVAVPFLILLVAAVLPILSGREETVAGLLADPRILTWLDYFQRDLNFGNIALGSGVGLASNAVNIVYGVEHFKGQIGLENLHLTIIAQYGLLGFLLLYSFIVAVLYKLYGRIGVVISIVMGVFGMAVVLWEIYPANLLIPVILAFHTSKSS